jgi:hypothetical protein
MNDEFELDFNEESENEKNITNRKKDHKDHKELEKNSKKNNIGSIRDLSKSSSRKVKNEIVPQNTNQNDTPSHTQTNNNIISNINNPTANTSRKHNEKEKQNLKYFFIFYNNNNYNQVKDFLYEKSLKIMKPNHYIFASKEIENIRNIYFMFVNNDKKLVKAIMKKDYIKYDRDHKKIDVIKLETKIK